MRNQKVFFGELERAIMDVLWSRSEATVRDVWASVERQRRVAYTTIMTVMNRLEQQGTLKRKPGPGGAFLYAPTHSRAAHSTLATKTTVNHLVAEYGDAALIQFLEKLDTIPEAKLNRLRKGLKRRSS